MRMLSYNIRYGGTGREKLLSSVIGACDPDVVIFEEATSPEVVQSLAAACSFKWWGAMRGHSIAYMAKCEVEQAIWHRIPFARRRFLELCLPSPSMHIFGVHLSAIHSNVTELRRTYELNALLRAVIPRKLGFHVMTGDFNTLAPGEPLDLSKLPPRLRAITWATGRNIRWRTIQMMTAAGYADGYRTLHPDGDAYTFPTWDPHVRLDYVFLPVPAARRLTRCEVVRDAPNVREASDHFPLLAEFADA